MSIQADANAVLVKLQNVHAEGTATLERTLAITQVALDNANARIVELEAAAEGESVKGKDA